VPAPTSGLARVTIRAPRRRLDLAIPHQVPLAELLPEVLRRAGEVTAAGASAMAPGASAVAPGGWVLRRGDGASLSGAVALAPQGVRDGDVLYLVPRNLTWPEPDYDDVVEEIAAEARKHGRSWDAAATRLFCLVAAGLVLLTGLGVLFAVGPRLPGLVAAAVALVLLCAGSMLSRALGDGVAGAAAAGFALPYAAASGVLLFAGDAPASRLSAGQVLVGSAALLLASVVGAVAVGHGLRVFAAGVTAGIFAGLGASLGFALTAPGAASILIVALVGGIGVAPLLAVRLGKLPLPVVTAAPDLLAAERRPEPPRVLAAVIRADEILAGSLLGISVVAVGCVAVLAATTGLAGPLLGGLASAALLLRARLFPSVAARLPLLGAGLIGLAVTAWATLGLAGDVLRLVALAAGSVAVVGLLATAHRRRAGGSPYLGRIADIVDVATVVALAPVACAVLDLYRFVRGLAG
jgi:type VII secretion integral membrane protein EccD